MYDNISPTLTLGDGSSKEDDASDGESHHGAAGEVRCASRAAETRSTLCDGQMGRLQRLGVEMEKEGVMGVVGVAGGGRSTCALPLQPGSCATPALLRPLQGRPGDTLHIQR